MENPDEKFRAIYDRYMPLLRLIASRKFIPYDEIDDMVQETFTSFYAHYPLTWPEYKIRAALARIMRNLCTDYLRRCRTHPITYMDSSTLIAESRLPGLPAAKNPLDIVLENQQFQDILSIFKTMKHDWAIVFLLYLIQGRSMSEVSRMLGISEAACRMRLMRARNYLKEQMALKGSDRAAPVPRSADPPRTDGKSPKHRGDVRG